MSNTYATSLSPPLSDGPRDGRLGETVSDQFSGTCELTTELSSIAVLAPDIRVVLPCAAPQCVLPPEGRSHRHIWAPRSAECLKAWDRSGTDSGKTSTGQGGPRNSESWQPLSIPEFDFIVLECSNHPCRYWGVRRTSLR